MNKLSLMMATAMGLVAASAAQAENIAIVGGTVHTMGTAGTVEGATVLIEGTTIKAVGADVTVPEGFRVVDAKGKVVTPGLMNAYTRLGVTEVGAVSSTNDHTINGYRGGRGGSNAVDAKFSAAFDISYGFNPQTSLIPILRLEGMTRAVVVPGVGRTSLFGGQAAVADLSGDWESINKAGAAQVAVLGQDGAGRAGGARGGAMFMFVSALKEAEAFARRGSKGLSARESDGFMNAMDAKALVPVVKGDMPIYVAVHRASDILQLIKLQDDFPKVDFVILGGAEGHMVADEIAAAGIPVVVDPAQNLPHQFDRLGSTLNNAGRLSKAGVKVILAAKNMDTGANARLVTQSAGIAVAHGMDWNAAMQAITVNPASVFGIGDTYGSLEVGMDADVVVWDGDPLEVMTTVEFVTVKGEEKSLETRQTKLRDRYMDLTQSDRPFAFNK